jgi:hypothetical protein
MRISENKAYVSEILAKQDETMVDNLLTSAGVKDINRRTQIKQLVQNTKNWMLSEEFTRSDDVVGLTPAFIPMVTRMMPSLIAPEIVGTQVLNTPVGLVWGWRVYLVGKDNDSHNSGGSRGDLTTDFYNGLMVQFKTQSELDALVVSDSTAPYTTYDIEIENTLGVDVPIGTFRILHKEEDNLVAFGKILSVIDVNNGAGGELNGVFTTGLKFTDKSFSDYLDTQLKAGKTLKIGNKEVTLVLKNWDKDYIFNSIFKNYTGSKPTNQLEGDNGIDVINRMATKLEKTVAEAQTRKLRVDFSFEAMQDAMALYNYDLQSELIKMAIRQIALEIDAEIINKVKKLAVINKIESFDFANVVGLDPISRIHSLVMTITKVAVQIAQDTRLGKGNILITNARGLALLQSLPIFEKSADYNGIGTSVQKAGTLGGVYKVFLDVYTNEDAIYVCYKGSSESEAGLIYAPYTPIQVKSVVGTETFNNHNLFYTRYALVENLYGSHKFYRKIELKHLVF